ncbi:MAG: hypothetical protein IJA10_13610 [Lachnospiraceae bacterium]|nr:hypothetical protein [Lachnospiraceae bacterium]
MTKMTEKEQIETIGGVKCPACGKNIPWYAYPLHGWCHIADETGVGTR